MPRRIVAECRPRKRSDGRWIAQPVVKAADGSKRRMTIIDPKKEVVLAKLAEVQSQQRKMIPFSAKDWTVGDYLDHWINNVAIHKIRISTWEGYESAIRLYIKPTIGRKKLNELGVRDITHTLDKLERKGTTPRNLQKFKQTLSSCLTYAMREELVFRNVAMIAKMPKYTPKPIFPWTVEQSQLFLESVSDDRFYAAYLMFLIYSTRAGETLGLGWSDIDFDNDIVFIQQQIVRAKGGRLFAQTVKTDAGRRPLPLVPIIKQAFMELAAKNGIRLDEIQFSPNREPSLDNLAFTTKFGTAINPNDFRKRYFYEAIDKSGLPRIKLHHTRHTAATLLKDMGVPIKDVQEILGHTDIKTTLKIYQHGSPTIKRKALTALGEGLTARISGICSQNVQSNSKISLINKNQPLLTPAKRMLKPLAYETLSKCSCAFAAPVFSTSEHEQIDTNTS